MASNGTPKKKALYDEFLEAKGLSSDETPGFGGPCSVNNIKERIQSCYPGSKPSSDAPEISIKGEEGESEDLVLLKSQEDQINFIKKIYEPVERSSVHGFDYDEKSLKMWLLDERSKDSFKLIGVVGVLGVGKTTLCRLIFNDEEVKQRFVPRLWIPMSAEPWKPMSEEPESMESVVERMLEHLGVEEETIKSISKDHKLPGLLYALYLHLKGKRFLIVLDDVRDHKDKDKEKRPYYEDLVSCLKNGHGFPKGYGGAVIVTSRNEEAIKNMVEEQNLHRLLPLSDPESCWKIYKYKDFDASKEVKEEVKKDEAPGSGADAPKEGSLDVPKAIKEEVKKDEAQGSEADASKEGSRDVPKEVKKEVKKDEAQGSGADAPKEGSRDVPQEVKEELKKRCGGFPLVARMMGEIKLRKEHQGKNQNVAAGSNQETSDSKKGSDEATIASKNSSIEAPTTAT